MGVDKIGPYGLTEEEQKQEMLLFHGIESNPYAKGTDEYDIWRMGYFRAWSILDERFAELCAERP